jgi:methionyl-tRNA synthetase
MSRFYLTTAIDYVNSRPHLGTAYEKITADVIARYRRLRGDDTHFVMGNDEHSQNVYRRAVELGLDPLAYCDRMEQEFRDVWRRLDISFDDFIRTTEPRHRAGVTALAERIGQAGDLYEGYYEGWYCVSCEAFKQEKDLVDGHCPVHQRPPEWIREKNHFFRLSKYRQPLLDHFAAHPGFLVPDVRRNEILRLLEGGLEDISISRAGQAWGIPLPSDPASVVYVWFDALINYASAVGLGSDPERFARWWPADLHVIGKDITRFHAVVWPAMLMSAGVDLPRQIFGHGFVFLKGQKMSKSLGTILDPLEAADRFGADPLRLYLVKEIAYGADGDFSWERFEERYNVDLANNLGNLVNRVAAMSDRYRGGRLRASGATAGRLAALAEAAAAGQRVHRRDRAVDARARSRPGRSPDAGALRRDGGRADRGDAAPAGHAVLVGRDTAAGGGAAAGRARLRSRRGVAPRRRARGRQGRPAVAAAGAGNARAWRTRGHGRAIDPESETDDRRTEGPARSTRARAPRPGGRRADLDRRLHEGRAARGQGAGRREGAQLEEAHQAAGGRRHRAAHAGRRHRRGLRGRVAGRTHRGHRVQPEAGQADGDRVERHGPRREPRGREALARDFRGTRPAAGQPGEVEHCRLTIAD